MFKAIFVYLFKTRQSTLPFWLLSYLSTNTRSKNILLVRIVKCIHLSLPGYPGYLSLTPSFTPSHVICRNLLFIYKFLFKFFHLSLYFPLLYLPWVFLFFIIVLFRFV